MEVNKEQLRATKESLDLKRESERRKEKEGEGVGKKGQKAFNGPGANLNHDASSLCGSVTKVR